MEDKDAFDVGIAGYQSTLLMSCASTTIVRQADTRAEDLVSEQIRVQKWKTRQILATHARSKVCARSSCSRYAGLHCVHLG